MKELTKVPLSPRSDPRLETLLGGLRKSKLRLTGARRKLVEALLEEHGPFTVEQVHRRVRSCDRVTVYRTLSSLARIGLARRCDFGDGMARYELTNPDDHHHHVICRGCDEVQVLEECELDEVDQVVKRLGFSEVSHSLEFFGVCPKCA